MLDKLNLSKFLLLFIFCGIFCCTEIHIPQYNTEMICPDGKRILIKYARMQEVREALLLAVERKQWQRTSEDYTPVRLRGDLSFRIEKLSPERALECTLVESPIGQVDQKYIRHFR